MPLSLPGPATLTSDWTDSDFDAALGAFYYVRVIEISKPRWTAYDRKFFSAKIDPEVHMTTQDRASTSISAMGYTP